MIVLQSMSWDQTISALIAGHTVGGVLCDMRYLDKYLIRGWRRDGNILFGKSRGLSMLNTHKNSCIGLLGHCILRGQMVTESKLVSKIACI